MNAFRALATIGCVSIALIASAANATTVIDFNGETSNGVPSLTFGVVTFTAEGGGLLFTSDYGVTPNGTVGLLANDNGAFVPIRATIVGGASFVSIDLGDYGSDDDALFLRLYDANDVLLASADAFINSGFTGMVTLSASASGTAYAVFGGIGGFSESNVYADNFTFAAVPEPASWAMLIAGFGLVGAASRRQRVLQYARA